MRDLGVDVSGSQKVLACSSGVSLIAPSDRTQHRLETIDSGCMYLDLKRALMNAERGQTSPSLQPLVFCDRSIPASNS